MIDIFDIDASLDSLKVEAEQRYQHLLVDLVAGKHIDAGALRDAQRNSDRTRNDLKRHVRLLLGRKNSVAAIERADEIAGSLASLEAEAKQARTPLRKAFRRWFGSWFRFPCGCALCTQRSVVLVSQLAAAVTLCPPRTSLDNHWLLLPDDAGRRAGNCSFARILRAAAWA